MAVSLSVPGSEGSHNWFHRRSSSLKLSRRRSKSVGPSHKRKGSFQSSDSVDHHKDHHPSDSTLAKCTEGNSAPNISAEGPAGRSVRSRRSSSLRRKRSVDATVFTNKNLLGVPGAPPPSQPGKHVQTDDRIKHDKDKNSTSGATDDTTSHLKIPEISLTSVSTPSNPGNKSLMLPGPPISAAQKASCSSPPDQQPSVTIENKGASSPGSPGSPSSPSDDSTSSSGKTKSNNVPRPGKLTLKECYPQPQKQTRKQPVALVTEQPTISSTNGPLTSVEVHHANSSNPNSCTNLLTQPEPPSCIGNNLLVPHAKTEALSDSCESFCISQSEHKRTDKLDLRTSPDKNIRKKECLISVSDSLQAVVSPQPSFIHANYLNLNKEKCNRDGAAASKFDDEVDYTENHALLGAECPSFQCDVIDPVNVADLENHFDNLVVTSDCIDEVDDHIDSMTELISDSFKNTILTNSTINPAPDSFVAVDGPKLGHYPNPHHSPVIDERPISKNSSRKGSGSLASFSRSSRSGSGRRSGSGKLKSPTTPSWMVLKSPLARIESFHSDDFECLADSDIEERRSVADSPMSATTPTVPCFAYKLHMMKKKQTKLKTNNANGNGSLGHKENSSTNAQNSSEKKQALGSTTTRFLFIISSHF